MEAIYAIIVIIAMWGTLFFSLIWIDIVIVTALLPALFPAASTRIAPIATTQLTAYGHESAGDRYAAQALFSAVSSPAETPTAPGATHVVAKGDTLFSISRRYGMTVAELMRINRLNNALIYVGQVLRITSSPSGNDGVYTVMAGDTLYSLARRHGTTVDAIRQANGLAGTHIYVGQLLRMGRASTTLPSEHAVYTVVRGDTLYSIAGRYGTTVEAVMAANRLSGTLIYVGQLLLIPKGVTMPPTSTATPTLTGTVTVTGTATSTPTVTPTPTATVEGPCPCIADTLNCADFGLMGDAQACFDFCVAQGAGDIHGLDNDNDNLACENNE